MNEWERGKDAGLYEFDHAGDAELAAAAADPGEWRQLLIQQELFSAATVHYARGYATGWMEAWRTAGKPASVAECGADR